MRQKDGTFGKKHGLYYTRIYKIWRGMKQRCYDKNCKDYVLYGDRGVTVCNDWLDNPTAFFDWSIKNGYKENLTLDRIDCNSNYSQSNCRWITLEEQQRNKRNNRRIAFMGEVFCLSEWAELTGISYRTLKTRLDRGWNIERALTERVQKHQQGLSV